MVIIKTAVMFIRVFIFHRRGSCRFFFRVTVFDAEQVVAEFLCDVIDWLTWKLKSQSTCHTNGEEELCSHNRNRLIVNC